MGYTLGAAAKATGLSKPTIRQAIKSGKITAGKNIHGHYDINPAELHRVYPPISKEEKPPEAANSNSSEAALLREQIDLLKEERERERRQYEERLREVTTRLDSETEERRQVSAMLEDLRQKQQRGWFKRVFGRK